MSIQEMLQEKHKEEIARLEELVFDTLGDMIDPKKIGIQVLGGGKLALYLKSEIDFPEAMLMDEWGIARENTEFAEVELYGKDFS